MIDFIIANLIIIAIYSIVVLCINLIMGYIGYQQLGGAGFYGVGAYTFAILTLQGIPFFICLLAGGFTAGLSGLLLGLPTLRLKSHYIAITSLGFLYIVYSLIINLNDLTRGPLGIPGIPRPTIFGYTFNDNFSLLLLILPITFVIWLIIYRLVNSPFGKILETIRENDLAAKTLGKNTYAYKLQTYIISAFFTGIAGGLGASFFNFIGPNDFFVNPSIFFITCVMLGGAGSFWGSIVGTSALWSLFLFVKFLPIPPNAVGPAKWMSYSLILILIMIFRPRGIMGRKIRSFEK